MFREDEIVRRLLLNTNTERMMNILLELYVSLIQHATSYNTDQRTVALVFFWVPRRWKDSCLAVVSNTIEQARTLFFVVSTVPVPQLHMSPVTKYR